MEEVVEGTGSLTEGGAVIANAGVPALGGNCTSLNNPGENGSTVAIDILEESDSLTQVRAKAVQSPSDHLVRAEKWAKDHGFDVQAHHGSLKAKISSTGVGVHKKGKTGRTKRDSQAAADGNLRSVTADASNSVILATVERLKGL
ncbi:hypothetical protein FRC01_012396 [Tulasnella sp. 417]|nr:hypothetical protein FRC01_012396 [Tulasnella sp. 417]